MNKPNIIFLFLLAGLSLFFNSPLPCFKQDVYSAKIPEALLQPSSKNYTARINSVFESNLLSFLMFGEVPGERDWFLFDLHETIYVNLEFNPEFVENDFLRFFDGLRCKKAAISFKDPSGVPESIRRFLPKKFADSFSAKINGSFEKNLKKSGVQFDLRFDFPITSVNMKDGILMYTKKKDKQGNQFACNKGEMIELLLSDVPKHLWPRRVFFIDDGSGSVHLVHKALQKLGIDSFCFYYPLMWKTSTLIAKAGFFWPQFYIPFKALKNVFGASLPNEVKLTRLAKNQSYLKNAQFDKKP